MLLQGLARGRGERCAHDARAGGAGGAGGGGRGQAQLPAHDAPFLGAFQNAGGVMHVDSAFIKANSSDSAFCYQAFCSQAKTMHGLGFASKQVVVFLRECCRSTLESSEASRWPTAGA